MEYRGHNPRHKRRRTARRGPDELTANFVGSSKTVKFTDPPNATNFIALKVADEFHRHKIKESPVLQYQGFRKHHTKRNPSKNRGMALLLYHSLVRYVKKGMDNEITE